MVSNVWLIVSELLGQRLGTDSESIARFWVANKRHKVINIISLSVLWSVWKLRNEICFQGVKWTGMRKVIWQIGMLRKQDVEQQVEHFASQLEIKANSPPQLQWRMEDTSSLSELEPLDARRSVSVNVALVRLEELLSDSSNVGNLVSVIQTLA